jgi:hypothetical protein
MINVKLFLVSRRGNEIATHDLDYMGTQMWIFKKQSLSMWTWLNETTWRYIPEDCNFRLTWFKKDSSGKLL